MVSLADESLSRRRASLATTGRIPVHRQFLVSVERRQHLLGVGPQIVQLLVTHHVNLLKLVVSISSNELLDDHETATDANNQLAVKNLRVNLLSTEPVLTAANLAQRHRAVSRVDVLAEHLIEDVTLGHAEDGSLLLIANLLVHDLDDSVFVLEQEVHLFDLINLRVDRVGEIAETLDKLLLILLESSDVLLMAGNVSVKISDLRRLKLDLLVEVDLLLSNDIELLDLLVDNLLALLQSTVDLLNLLLDLLDLVLSVLNDLIAVQDLTLQMVRQLVLFGLLEVLVEQLLSLKQELSLLLTNFLHRREQVLNLFDILAGLGLICNVRNV